MDYVIAFVVGGVICALAQILMEKTKMMPGRIMVLLVCLGAVLGAFQIYEPFANWAKAGATVPLLGFGNNLWKGVKEMIDESFWGDLKIVQQVCRPPLSFPIWHPCSVSLR